MKKIVVGIDGSRHAEAAVDFAAEEACVHKADLLVVSAWEIPMLVDPMAAYPAEWLERMQADSESLVEAALARVKDVCPEVHCEGKAVEGHPATVLLEEGANADLIVLGSHGRGEIATLLLGSVTQRVIHSAHCPVVVVRLP
jgi:nucleotide-binding universal stress UspA family protein